MSKSVVAYFDFGSPWSYLAHALAKKALPGVAIEWRPVYLRGLEMFANGIPYTGDKLRYLTRDLGRCVAHEGVPLAPPASFPVDGLTTLRAAYVAKDHDVLEPFIDAAFRAAWAESRDITDKAFVAGLLAEIAHVDAGAILTEMTSQPVKDRLRESTEEAQKRGVFGAPTFFVGDEMFWGHDRLDYVARAAAAG